MRRLTFVLACVLALSATANAELTLQNRVTGSLSFTNDTTMDVANLPALEEPVGTIYYAITQTDTMPGDGDPAWSTTPPATATFTVAPEFEGEVTLWAWTKDSDDPPNVASASTSVIYTTTPPTAKVKPIIHSTTNVITPQMLDGGSTGGTVDEVAIPIHSMAVSCDEEPTCDLTPEEPFVTLAEEGSYTLTFTVMNEAGNTASADVAVHYPAQRAPGALPDLVLWLDAQDDTAILRDENDRVKWWIDKSGNNYSVTHENSDQHPLWVGNGLNDRPVVNFAGEHNLNTLIPDFNNTSTNFTLIWVGAGGAGHEHGGISNGDFASGWRRARTADWQSAPYNTPGADFILTHIHKRNITEYEIYLNGTFFENRFFHGWMHNASPLWAVGSSGTAGTDRSYDGSIAEVLVFQGRLTDSQRQLVEAYLRKKWGFQQPDEFAVADPVTGNTEMTGSTEVDVVKFPIMLEEYDEYLITEDPSLDEPAEGWLPYDYAFPPETTTFTAPAQDGTVTLYLWLRDSQGLALSRIETSIEYVTVPPVAVAKDITSDSRFISAADIDDGSVGGEYGGEPLGIYKMYVSCDEDLYVDDTFVAVPEPGVYTVTLHVINDAGNEDTATATVTVLEKREPSEIPGLALWLDAAEPTTILTEDDGRITRWADKSGLGNHADTPDVYRRPLYQQSGFDGQPVVNFAGNTVLQAKVHELNNMNSYTAFWVGSNASGADTSGITRFTNAGNPYGNHVIGWRKSYMPHAGSIVNEALEPGDNFIRSEVHYRYVFEDNGEERGPRHIWCYANGIHYDTFTSSHNADSAWAARLEWHIGASNVNASSGQYGGGIAEVLLFDRALTDAERETVELYLATKWGFMEPAVLEVAEKNTGETRFTRNAEVDVVNFDAQLSFYGEEITGYLITETDVEPDIETAPWSSTPPPTHIIQSGEGLVTLYGWVREDDTRVHRAVTTILYSEAQPVVSNIEIIDNEDGTATVKWDTDIPAYGDLEYRHFLGEWATVAGTAPVQNHEAEMEIEYPVIQGDYYEIVLSNNGFAHPTIIWPEVETWPIPSDANRDCIVDLLDLVFVRNRLFAAPEGENASADVNADGFIDLADLIEVRNNLGAVCEE